MVIAGYPRKDHPFIFSMTTFLGMYRGAAIYEVSEVDPSEGEMLGSKVIAKALIPDQENMKVDFIEDAATQQKAVEKIKKAIDKYLADHDMDKFVIDIL